MPARQERGSQRSDVQPHHPDPSYVLQKASAGKPLPPEIVSFRKVVIEWNASVIAVAVPAFIITAAE